MEEFTKEEKLILYKCDNDIYKIIENYDYLYKISDNPKKEFLKIKKMLKIRLDWKRNISKMSNLPISFIRDFKEKLNWRYVSYNINHKINIQYVEEFKDYLDWDTLCSIHDMPEDFIRKYLNYVSWGCISRSQDLSEDFIREFKNEVWWRDISNSQNLSDDFIREFKFEIYWEELKVNYKIPANRLKRLREEIFNE